MKKFLKLVALMLLVIPVINVNAANYEAKLVVKGTSPSDTEFNYETVEEAFAAIPEKETEFSSAGNVYIMIQLLEDVEVETTLLAKTTRVNFQLDMNGKDIVSSADPVLEFKVGISGIMNVSEEPCSITQKNVKNVSTTTPNTIVSLPLGCMSTMLSAKNVTFGDGTGTAVNSTVTMPLSVSAGIYLGKMILAKPMFLSAVTGGTFDQDPTEYIDTNAYIANKTKDGLYVVDTFIAARAKTADGTIVKKYGDIQVAFDELEDGEEIQILKQAYPTETVLIDKDEKILIDFHGFQFLASGCPNSALTINSNVFIKNLGDLTITSKTTKTATNFVYDAQVKDEFVSTIQNKGDLKLQGIYVNVNYNQPGRKGPIYTITNDSTTSDAMIYIDADTTVGGLLIEPEDPATGKYPALHTTGDNYKYENVINIEYKGKDKDSNEDNDNIIFLVEDTVVTDIIEEDVFDAEGNFKTTMYLTNGIDLQKKNISVKKDGKEIEFEYDPTTDSLTIPASNFTDGKDTITINYKYQVTYIVDGKVLAVVEVQVGTDSKNPEIPEKDGFKAEWNNDGKSIFEDRTITAVYTSTVVKDEKEELPPKTADAVQLWVITLIDSSICLAIGIALKKYREKAL